MAKGVGTRRGSKGTAPTLPNTLVSGVQSATPSTGRQPGAQISNPFAQGYYQQTKDIRSITDVRMAIRMLARYNGDVSAATSAMVRLANTKLSFKAFDINHQLSEAGTTLVRSLLARFDHTADYTLGFDDRPSMSGLVESLLREIPLSGAVAAELVLDDLRLPFRINAIPVPTIKWEVGKQKVGKTSYKLIPFQYVSGNKVYLDVPTFFYAALDQDPGNVFPHSPVEPALNTTFFHAEVVEDIRRVVNRSGHSRLMVKLNVEMLRKAAPMEYQADATKLQQWMDDVRLQVKTELENLAPETAIVYFDTLEADYLNSEIGASADYSSLMETLDGLQSTALKTPPSVIGKRMGGSQNTSSTESLLFLKTAACLQPPVAALLSRVMTLATRLYGFPGYVKAEFEAIDLRPELETMAFQLMKQQLVLERLSYGFLTDQEAAEALNTGPRAPGAPELSGTMFYTKNGPTDMPSANDNPATRALTTDAPASGGGKDNAQRK